MDAIAVKITDWHGCYDQGWEGIIVDEAFAHPAKFAYGLICRIVDHGLAQGYWRKGDLLGDCFGGVALGGIICGGRGLNWIGVELEERFCELGNRNLAKHGPAFMLAGAAMVKLVQGDSRRFAEIVGEMAGVVSSPPFTQGYQSGGGINKNGYGPDGADKVGSRTYQGTGGEPSEGNIENLPAGKLDGIVSSPPWEDQAEGGLRGQKFKDPLAFASAMSAKDGTKPNRHAASPAARAAQLERDANRVYGDSPGQIGRDSGEHYWSAMKLVYASVHAAMRPGAVAALVVKDYIKAGKRVPLCDDTCRLLESLGFEVFERTRAWLVKNESHPGLFGEKVTKTKSRKSFFRRLAEKNGSPEINWEKVIWCRR